MTERRGGKKSAEALSLDHVALVSPDLEVSKEDYEKLGFSLTRQSSHKGPAPGGEVELWGSGNRCAMFRRGYFEILGVTDPGRPHDHFRALLDRFHGVQLLALRCDSAEALHRKRKKRVDGLRPPVEVGRDVPVGLEGDGTVPGLFRLVHLEADAFPEAELFFIEHVTPDALWQPALLEHPNGVTGLAGATLCADAPEETAGRFERATLVKAEGAGDEIRFELGESFVAVTGPDALAAAYPRAVLPAIPAVAVVTLTVEDLGRARAYLETNGVTPHLRESEGEAIWVRPERTGGVILEFVQDHRTVSVPPSSRRRS